MKVGAGHCPPHVKMRGPTVWVFAKTPCTNAPPTSLAQTTGGALLTQLGDSPFTQHLPFKVLTNLRQKTNHGETTNSSTVTSTQVSLTMEQPAFTQVPSDLEYAMPSNHRTPTTPRLPKAPRYMFAHWAPLSDDTKTTRATFQQWCSLSLLSQNCQFHGPRLPAPLTDAFLLP